MAVMRYGHQHLAIRSVSLHAHSMLPVARAPKYSSALMDHMYKLRNTGSFDDADPDVGTGFVGHPKCGDLIKFQVRVRDGRVVDSCFKAYGCGSAIATSAEATQLIRDQPLAAAKTVTNAQLAQRLALPPIKLHCSALAEQAIRSAITNYEEKQAKQPQDALTAQDQANPPLDAGARIVASAT